MPTYRIFYVEREVDYKGEPSSAVLRPEHIATRHDYVSQTDWEETYDGRNAEEALVAFFRDHSSGDGVRIVEEDGEAREVGLQGYDPDRTYIWIEETKDGPRLMEYQGLDEATPGLVSCPLCDGTGEVDDATAEHFYEAYDSGATGDQSALDADIHG